MDGILTSNVSHTVQVASAKKNYRMFPPSHHIRYGTVTALHELLVRLFALLLTWRCTLIYDPQSRVGCAAKRATYSCPFRRSFVARNGAPSVRFLSLVAVFLTMDTHIHTQTHTGGAKVLSRNDGEWQKTRPIFIRSQKEMALDRICFVVMCRECVSVCVWERVSQRRSSFQVDKTHYRKAMARTLLLADKKKNTNTIACTPSHSFLPIKQNAPKVAAFEKKLSQPASNQGGKQAAIAAIRRRPPTCSSWP